MAKTYELSADERDEIYELKSSLEGQYGDYNNHIDDLFDAYGGVYKDRKRYGVWNKLLSKVYPWYVDENREKLYVVLNLSRPIIEAKRGLIGSVPQVRVPTYDTSDEAQEHSDLLEKVIQGVWNWSNIGKFFGDLGFLLPLCGSAVAGVRVNIAEKRPELYVRSPQGFYPLVDSEDASTLGAAMFVSTYTGREAGLIWPDYKEEFSKENEIEVIDYWDKEKHVKIADERYVLPGSGYHGLPWVPLIVIPNLPIPGSVFGDSDIDAVLELQKELNRRFMLESDAILYYLFPPIMVKDPLGEITDLATEPGGVIPVGEKGDIRTVQPGNVPYEWERSKDFLLSMVDRMTDYTETLRGQVSGSIVTGKGVNAILGPLQSRIQVRYQYIHPAVQHLNKLALWIYANKWKGTEHSVFGTSKGDRFGIKFTAEQLGQWFENEVFLDAMQFIDQQARVVMGLQLVQNKIIPRRELRRTCGWTQDVTAAEREIEAETQKDIRDAMSMQAMAQANQQPDLGEPARTAYGLERGYVGETEPMQPAGGSEQLQGMPPEMMEMGMEEGDILDDFADMIRSCPKIRGRVFLVGGILKGDLSGGIDIYITEGNDQQTIINWVKKHAPDLDGEMNFWRGVPEPPYLEVTPGTEGYEPTGGGRGQTNPQQGAMAALGGAGLEGALPLE